MYYSRRAQGSLRVPLQPAIAKGGIMEGVLTIDMVEKIIARRFPDEEPELPSVRAYRAISSLLLSAAMLTSSD